jgi:hypothetical protein
MHHMSLLRLNSARRLSVAWILAASTTLLLSEGCGRVPVEDFRPAQAALNRARDARAEEYAPAALDSAQAFLARASAMNISVPRTWYGWPKSDLIRGAISESVRWSTVAVTTSDSLHAERIHRNRDQLTGVEQQLRTIERQLSTASGKRLNRRLLREAQVDLKEAGKWLDRGEASRAEAVLARLKGRSSDLGTRLAEDLRRFDNPDAQRNWRKWLTEGMRIAQNGRKLLVIEKESRTSYLVHKGRVLYRTPVDLGVEGTRVKTSQGDLATPEGLYTITKKKGNGQTKYYKALLLDYPNAEDVARFRALKKRGAISANARLGGLIEVHGDGGRGEDWTLGCVAVGNSEMDRLYRELSVGDKVAIVGRVPEDVLRGTAR